MTRSKQWTILASAGLILCLGIAGAKATSSLLAKPTAVATADLQSIFDQLKEAQSLQADIQDNNAKIKDEAATKKEEIQRLKQEVEELQPGSESYNKLSEDLALQAHQLQAWGAYHEQRIARQNAVNIKHLYEKTLQAINQVAQENGYDLVLYNDINSKLQYQNVQQLLAQLSNRKILYASSAIDLTDQVIQRMNNEFDMARE